LSLTAKNLKKKYDLRSEFFFDAYSNGWLEDDGKPDFTEWAGFFKSKIDRGQMAIILNSNARNTALNDSSSSFLVTTR